MCILGLEPDGSGGCKPCDKYWFREELSAQSCNACSSLDAAFITETFGSNSSSLCGEFSELSGTVMIIFQVCFVLAKNRNFYLKTLELLFVKTKSKFKARI